MQIVIGLVGAVLSIVLIIYRVPVKHFMGNINWAEEHLGSGGTYTLLILIGIFGFFFSLMYMTGSLNFIFGGFAERFFGSSK